MTMPQDRYINIGGVNIRYWAEGSQGQPIVLIHGLGGYIENWLPCFERFTTRHRVFALDLPGFGRSDKPAYISYKIADLARFVKDFMAALQIEHAHVIGLSLGGAISTRLTILYPELVDKLVLISSAGFGKEAIMILRIASLPIVGDILTRPSRSGSANFAKTAVYDPKLITEELIERDYQMAAQSGAQQSFLATLRANGNFLGQGKSMYEPNLQGLAAITHPVLVVWGQQDRLIPVAHAEVAAKGLPNVRTQIFDHCGHLPMLEHTQTFNELVLDFLSQSAGSSNAKG